MTIRESIATLFSAAVLFVGLSGVAVVAAYSPAGSAQMHAEAIGFDALAVQVFGNSLAEPAACNSTLATLLARDAQ